MTPGMAAEAARTELSPTRRRQLLQSRYRKLRISHCRIVREINELKLLL